MKASRPHRPGFEQKDSRKREVRKQLMYKIDEDSGEYTIYATPERAVFHSRVMRALKESTTWAEFRRAMPCREYSRLLRELFDENALRRPHGSDAFDEFQIPDVADGVYPGWLLQEMLDGVLPADILEKCGQYASSMHNGPCVWIRPKDLDRVNAELEKRGYELIDGSGLHME